MTLHTKITGACKIAALIALLSATGAYAQQGSGGDLSPAKSNCNSSTGCANYSTGNPTRDNPTQQNMNPAQQKR